jgi:hypothetical protein
MWRKHLTGYPVLVILLAIGNVIPAQSASAQSTLDPALAFAAISGGDLKLDKNATVGGAAGTLGRLTLDKGANVSGDGKALGGEIKLAKDAVVSGICATAGGKIILGKNAVCSGGVDTSGSSPALVPLQTFASAGARACPPGGISEGDLTLKKTARLH